MSSDSKVINKSEVSPKSSFAMTASTPEGSCDLKFCKPSLIFDQTSSLLFTSSFSSTITYTIPSLDMEYVFFFFTSLKVNRYLSKGLTNCSSTSPEVAPG